MAEMAAVRTRPPLKILAAIHFLPQTADLSGILTDEKFPVVLHGAFNGEFASRQSDSPQPY